MKKAIFTIFLFIMLVSSVFAISELKRDGTSMPQRVLEVEKLDETQLFLSTLGFNIVGLGFNTVSTPAGSAFCADAPSESNSFDNLYTGGDFLADSPDHDATVWQVFRYEPWEKMHDETVLRGEEVIIALPTGIEFYWQNFYCDVDDPCVQCSDWTLDSCNENDGTTLFTRTCPEACDLARETTLDWWDPSCGEAPCEPNWDTSAWGVCEAGIQQRTVTDTNSCDSLNGKPSSSQECSDGVEATCDPGDECKQGCPVPDPDCRIPPADKPEIVIVGATAPACVSYGEAASVRVSVINQGGLEGSMDLEATILPKWYLDDKDYFKDRTNLLFAIAGPELWEPTNSCVEDQKFNRRGQIVNLKADDEITVSLSPLVPTKEEKPRLDFKPYYTNVAEKNELWLVIGLFEECDQEYGQGTGLENTKWVVRLSKLEVSEDCDAIVVSCNDDRDCSEGKYCAHNVFTPDAPGTCVDNPVNDINTLEGECKESLSLKQIQDLNKVSEGQRNDKLNAALCDAGSECCSRDGFDVYCADPDEVDVKIPLSAKTGGFFGPGWFDTVTEVFGADERGICFAEAEDEDPFAFLKNIDPMTWALIAFAFVAIMLVLKAGGNRR